MLVFTAFFIVVQPQVGHDLVDRGRHQSGKDRIARVLCRRRQDATVKILLFNFEQTVQHRLDHPPLVVPEIVDQKKRSLRSGVHHREHFFANQVLRHHRRIVVGLREPVQITVFDKFGKFVVRFVLLVRENLADARIGRFGELHLPVIQLAVDLHPIGERPRIGERRRNAPELAAVIGRGLFGDQLLAVNVLFDRQQHLIRINRLDQVVGDLRSDRFVHDVLLLAFGNHDHRGHRPQLLDPGQRFEPRQPRHHLVEDHQVELPRSHQVDRIVTVVAGLHVITFSLQKQDMGFQQINLVVHP